MRLMLVRHGRTASNVAALLDTAAPGAVLDETGRRQAALLAERLAGESLGAVYASNLLRARQTAAPLASAIGVGVVVLEGLREIHAGEDEMSPDWTRYVGALRAWGEGELGARVPGGEDAVSFFSRYDAAIATIAASGHAGALAVSHGAALRMWLAARVRDVEVAEVVGRPLRNTTVVTLEGAPGTGWAMVSWVEGPADA